MDAKSDPDAQPWSVIFQVNTSEPKIVGVDIKGVTVVGRAEPDDKEQPDFDLTPYGAFSHGVSRRHAILMPTAQGLTLIDLGSTNGTWLNGRNLKHGQRYRIRTGDYIEFGTLRMDVRLVGAVSTGGDSTTTMVTRDRPRRDDE